eukprot:4566962-Pleurochrysis_carterae.AAC.2
MEKVQPSIHEDGRDDVLAHKYWTAAKQMLHETTGARGDSGKQDVQARTKRIVEATEHAQGVAEIGQSSQTGARSTVSVEGEQGAEGCNQANKLARTEEEGSGIRFW